MKHLAIAAFILISLAGCAETGTSPTSASSNRPAPTPIAVTLTAHKLAIPGYAIQDLTALATGFAFAGTQTSTGTYGLFAYSYASKAVTQIVSINEQDGVQRQFSYLQSAGNVVVYIQTPPNALDNWIVGAVDASTGKAYDLNALYGGISPQQQFPGTLMTDGQSIIANVPIIQQGAVISHLNVFDLDTQQNQVVLTGSSLYWPAIFGQQIVYKQSQSNEPQDSPDPVFLLPKSGGQSRQIGTAQGSVNLAFDGQDVVWDSLASSESGTLQGITLATGKMLPLDAARCVRPVLVSHFVACQNIDTHFSLVDLATGIITNFAQGADNTDLDASPDRLVWIDSANQTVEYALLPA